MKKNTLKINENTLKQIVTESVKKILTEDFNDKNILHWYDESENIYTIYAMIKSDMNPIGKKFKATNINDAIKQALDYFVRFTSNGEKDVDIYYIKHDGYDGI